MNITKEQLVAIMPKKKGAVNLDSLVQNINTAMAEFGIVDVKDVAAFLATIAVESAQLSVYSENLNYSTEGLLRTFGKYFTKDTAPLYARNPEKIANKVYAGRMGNGNELSHEGWLHRGAGAIQLTGKANQMACAKHFGIGLDVIGDWLRTDKGAIRSAGYFWKTNNISALKGDIEAVSKKVNGGVNGMDERKAFYETALKVLK